MRSVSDWSRFLLTRQVVSDRHDFQLRPSHTKGNLGQNLVGVERPNATDVVGWQAETDRKFKPGSKSCNNERDAPPSVASAAVNGFENDIEREEAVVEVRLPVMLGGS